MRLELRLVGPLMFVAGYSFDWQTLHTISPLAAKLLLLTPWMYIYEGSRAAILGQSGYLNWWLCLAAISLFSLVFIVLGLRSFKKVFNCI